MPLLNNLKVLIVVGQDRFSPSKLYMRGAVGCFIITDITKPQGLESALKWRDLIMGGVVDLESMHMPMIIFQNKLDSVEEENVKDYQTLSYLNEFVHKNNFSAGFQVSAKEGTNINETLETLLKEVFGVHSEESRNSISRLTIQEESLLKLNKKNVERTQRKSVMYRYKEIENDKLCSC